MKVKDLKTYYKYHKEMHKHYSELFEVSAKELQFTRTQEQYYKSIIDEVQELVKKGCNKKLIDKVIELGKLKHSLNISIHYDTNLGGIDNNTFKSKQKTTQ